MSAAPSAYLASRRAVTLRIALERPLQHGRVDLLDSWAIVQAVCCGPRSAVAAASGVVVGYLARTVPARLAVVGWSTTSEPVCGDLGFGECLSQRLGEMMQAAVELAVAVVGAYLFSLMLGVVLIVVGGWLVLRCVFQPGCPAGLGLAWAGCAGVTAGLAFVVPALWAAAVVISAYSAR